MTETMNYNVQEPKEVKDIIRRFLSMPLKELKLYQLPKTPYMAYITDAIFETEHLNPKKALDMELVELLCLIDSIGQNIKYETMRKDGGILSAYQYQLFHYNMLMRYLLSAYTVSIPVKLFLSLTFESFYRSLKGGPHSCQIREDYFSLKESIPMFMDSFQENSTLKQILDAASATLQTPWNHAYRSIKNYENLIMETQVVLGRILVDSFRMAFPQHFDLFQIKNKYKYKRKQE